ncbi:MAG TPA: MgtC/SapB family protein [Anaerolineales bacterium]|nr:MgtC/SapB family protein [Anaerolineales bacterium]
METMTELQMLGKIAIAALLGGLVGIEREFAERPAGLRTHMLVGATATLFVMLADLLLSSFDPRDIINADPVRIIEAIVVGISFLGAGTILKYRQEGERVVEGLTTSASILSVAAIGIAVALNAYILAVGAALLNLFINWGLMTLINRAKFKTKRSPD